MVIFKLNLLFLFILFIFSSNDIFFNLSINDFNVRTLYFLISPLPWEVRKIQHLLGLFDGLFYLFLLVLIFWNRKLIMKDPGLRNISIILLSFIITFSWGVGNFGTGLRHRAKFLVGILLLAAPLIPKFSFSRKKIK